MQLQNIQTLKQKKLYDKLFWEYNSSYNVQPLLQPSQSGLTAQVACYNGDDHLHTYFI